MSKEKQETKRIQNERQLDVYKLSVEAAMEIYELSKSFPEEERYSLTDQIRRSSQSVSEQITKGWKRRKDAATFVNKMNEAEGEAKSVGFAFTFLKPKFGSSIQWNVDIFLEKMERAYIRSMTRFSENW